MVALHLGGSGDIAAVSGGPEAEGATGATFNARRVHLSLQRTVHNGLVLVIQTLPISGVATADPSEWLMTQAKPLT